MRTAISNVQSVANGLTKTFGVVALGALLLTQSTALASAAEKYAAFVIDANNGRVLFSKNADDARFPASLTKMMTLYMLFEALEHGRTTLQTQMKVSAYAAARPPTKLRLKPGSTISVQDAILGLVTLSANDAAVVIGEHLGGSEERFASMMTAKARQLGMSRTVFKNANGLPNPAQRTTARDMARLGVALREHFPKEYGYFRTKSFNFRGRTIGSHNRLIGRLQGVDGIKTGYTNASGFNLVSSLATGNKKLVGVVMGGVSAPARDKEMAKLLGKYLPLASGQGGEPLIADASPMPAELQPRLPAPVLKEASYTPPSKVPLPNMRASIRERIEAAYDSNAGEAIARMSPPAAREVVGRDALRAALTAPRAKRQGSVMIPTASSLAPTGPVPPGSIPGGADYDPETTGSIAAAMPSAPSSAWVVQIAAMPDKDRAIDMLAEAKQRGGSALKSAEGFTQTIVSGSQTLYRVRFAGFQSKNDANKACSALKKRSYNCFAFAN